ncbi:hypothetical protein GUH47_00035 [Xanthomonas citri pv. citri]|nr:hypothetical protein ART_00071 [Achromobacter phage vB_Ade_ART]MBD4204413.1 hypothetical protein [Xanthomonas citri pv. citri]
MKNLIIALAFSLLGLSAQAQTINSTSNAATQSTAGATNAGNAQNINFNSRNDGTSTLRSAPPVAGQGFYGSFSADSCMVSGGGGGSVVGLGINMAVPVEDKNCNLRRNFERVMQASATTKDPVRSQRLETAAVDILCQSDEKTRAALMGQGLCSDGLPKPVQPRARQDLENFYTPG